VMCDTLRRITARVNERLGTNFNTIVMNVYTFLGRRRPYRLPPRPRDWLPAPGISAAI
jgi:hypothetical protein